MFCSSRDFLGKGKKRKGFLPPLYRNSLETWQRSPLCKIIASWKNLTVPSLLYILWCILFNVWSKNWNLKNIFELSPNQFFYHLLSIFVSSFDIIQMYRYFIISEPEFTVWSILLWYKTIHLEIFLFSAGNWYFVLTAHKNFAVQEWSKFLLSICF